MKVRPTLSANLIPALVCILLAGLLRYWIAPLATSLPDNYFSQMQFLVEDSFRPSINDPWETNTFTAYRMDQSLSNQGGVAIVQGNLNWSTASGKLLFENSGLYGVDRRTRMLVAGYGDVERSGQFLFPLHVEKKTYTYWDPMFIGQRSAVFDHSEKQNGLLVYVFHFSGLGMDETAGYAYLPDVPERYQVHTDGKGTLRVEPVSGIVVGYEEQGFSYLVDPASGLRLLPEIQIQVWSDQYTPETMAAQLERAQAAQLRILTFEVFLPAALALAGLAWLLAGWFRRSLK
jgi:hypothetical protein